VELNERERITLTLGESIERVWFAQNYIVPWSSRCLERLQHSTC
jgi:hypothetical protein